MKAPVITKNSRIKDLYQTPMGKDLVHKVLLQMNQKRTIITNPIVSHLKIKTVEKLLKKQFDPNFFDALLTLVNQERTLPSKTSTIQETWWKEAVFYQIYPRSFCDANQDGIGDIQGIISKLDYLQAIGVNAVWLSPIYDSPNDDNGYDIRDYYQILDTFGSMEDFELLLNEVHQREMKLIMDLVVNHTSDEHEWYKQAVEDTQSKYHDYYIFRSSKEIPNNWKSFFGGPAWRYESTINEWAMHLFSTKQMDLNWENNEVQEDIMSMIRWWLDKGVDGFRMDVINYLSKAKGLPDGNKTISDMIGYTGIEHYFYGPKLYDYLTKIKKQAFMPYNAFSVGEMPGIGMEMGKLLTGDDRHALDMFFSFDHLEAPGHVRFDDYVYDLNDLKDYLIDWTLNYGNHCWMALFYNNHDNPRFISKVSKQPEHRPYLSTLLAVIQLTLKGTPFIYQGDEIGAINQAFPNMNELRDVESLNMYQSYLETSNEQEAFNKVLAGSRDHTRVPMKWDQRNVGFSKGVSWIKGFDDTEGYDVESQMKQERSIWHSYQLLIELRKNNRALIYGDVVFYKAKKKDYFMYQRIDQDQVFWIECNLSSQPLKRCLDLQNKKLVYSNYEQTSNVLRPYEATIYRLR